MTDSTTEPRFDATDPFLMNDLVLSSICASLTELRHFVLDLEFRFSEKMLTEILFYLLASGLTASYPTGLFCGFGVLQSNCSLGCAIDLPVPSLRVVSNLS